MLLTEYVKEEGVNLFRVINASHSRSCGNRCRIFCYVKRNEDKEEMEMQASDRIFSLLPSDQADEVWRLWREFEEKETPEARYAASIDRLQPLLLNYHTEGYTWKMPGVNREKVYERMAVIKESMPRVWEAVEEIIEDSVKKGYLKG